MELCTRREEQPILDVNLSCRDFPPHHPGKFKERQDGIQDSYKRGQLLLRDLIKFQILMCLRPSGCDGAHL